MSAVPDRIRELLPVVRSAVDRIEARLSDGVETVDRQTWLVVGLSVALFVVFTAYLLLLYRRFGLFGADFGSYVHMFATTASGEGFLQQGKYIASHPGGSYWGGHFSVTLLLFLPVYAAVPAPETLLVAKSAVLAGSIPVLWAVARAHLSDRLAGVVVVVSYAANPFLWSAWSFDFQEQALLPGLVFGAYYAYVTERYRWFVGLVGAVALTNEFAIPFVVGLLVGLAAAAWRADRLRAVAPALAGGLLVAVLAQALAGHVVAQFSTTAGIPTASLAAPVRSVVDGPRVTVAALLGAVAANPSVLAATAAQDLLLKVAAFALFFAPVAYLALSDEVAVAAIAPFLGFAWLFAGRMSYYVFGAHYPLYLLPFVYVGAVRVAGRLVTTDDARRLLVRVFVVVLALSVVGSVSAGVERELVPETGEHVSTLRAAIDEIPREASLITQNDVYPHVADRPRASFVHREATFDRYQRRYGRVTPEYVLIDERLDAGPVDWAAVVTSSFSDRLVGEYGLYKYEDGIWIFRRGYEGPTTAITTDDTASPPADGPPTGPPCTASGPASGGCFRSDR